MIKVTATPEELKEAVTNLGDLPALNKFLTAQAERVAFNTYMEKIFGIFIIFALSLFTIVAIVWLFIWLRNKWLQF